MGKLRSAFTLKGVISRTTFLAVSTCLALSSASVLRAQVHAPDNSPNTIFFAGNILTGAHLTARPDTSLTPARVSALAITNATIVAVGTDADVLKLRGPHTVLVDLHGAFAMPGFNDAHVHIAMAGQQKLTVDLDNVPSLSDMLARIQTYAAAAKPGVWIVGAGWDQTKWTNQALPTRLQLDTVTSGHPAIFFRTDGHILVANSAALEEAGITSATPDPSGGKIDHDSNGAPTGVIREASAIALIEAKVPPPDPDTRRKALQLSIDDALAHGVTSLQDNSTWDDWLVLETMEHRGQLPIRIAEWLPFDLELPVLRERRASHDANDPLLHLTQLKGFMDGSLGSRTAAMVDPYTDDPGNTGLPRYKQNKLNQMAADRAAAGFQLGFHAIGDEANTMALNAFGAAEQVGLPADCPRQTPDPDGVVTSTPRPCPETGPKSFRLRIEHSQVLLPGDFDRFAQQGVIASMQPSHLLTDMAWAGARLGPKREKYAYAWRSMLDHGITLIFGTDFPVESISPFRGLYSAVTRMNEAGTQTFHPEQKLTIAEAIYAYTQASAYGEFRETIKGRLEPGFLADMVVLDRDLTTVDPRAILGTRVLRTVVGGKTVYLATPQPLASPGPAVPHARQPVPETD
jgi:predicted amidohydrolase YtcJ